MDPVTLGAVLLAIVTGVAEDAGGRLWSGLTALVRKPFRRGASSCAAELAALERAPADRDLAMTLAQALLKRADADAEFGRELERWWERAGQVRIGEGDVINTISGGTQHEPVLQDRDFSGITFGVAQAGPAAFEPPGTAPASPAKE